MESQFQSDIHFHAHVHYISKKSWPILYSKFLYEMRQGFLDIQYTYKAQKVGNSFLEQFPDWSMYITSSNSSYGLKI